LKIAFNFKLILTPSSRQKIKSQIQISKNTLNLNFNLEKNSNLPNNSCSSTNCQKDFKLPSSANPGHKKQHNNKPKKTSVSKTKDRQEKVLHLSSAVERKTEKNKLYLTVSHYRKSARQ
jgi:hypothetical protein